MFQENCTRSIISWCSPINLRNSEMGVLAITLIASLVEGDTKCDHLYAKRNNNAFDRTKYLNCPHFPREK